MFLEGRTGVGVPEGAGGTNALHETRGLKGERLLTREEGLEERRALLGAGARAGVEVGAEKEPSAARRGSGASPWTGMAGGQERWGSEKIS